MLDCRDWISISQSPDIPSSPKGMQVHKGSSGILSNYVHETNLNLPTSASFPLSVRLFLSPIPIRPVFTCPASSFRPQLPTATLRKLT